MTPYFGILRHRRRATGESGFTLIEVVFAMVLFAGLSAAMAGLLISAISANKLARQRTIADQAAMEQIEMIRRLPYQSVGVILGNPPGVVPATTPVTLTGLKGTITTQIQYIDDPTPTSYETTANYKRVTVTVRRNDDGRLLAREVTYVAPTSRTPFGGVNLAIVRPTVNDYFLNQPVENVTVDLLTGPSAPRSDVTDATGQVTFSKLTPNPGATCPPDCYDLTATLSGYVQLDAPTRINVGPGQTATPGIQIYRPSTINLVVNDSGGSPYAGTAFVKLTSARNGFTQTFSVTGGSLAVPTVNGEPITPNTQYTAETWTTGSPLCAAPLTKYVPDDYPSVLTTTFPLTLGACPSGSVAVTVTWGGAPAPGAMVTLSGGPYALNPVSGTTDAAGQVTFSNVPSGAASYTVQATKAGQNATPQNPVVTTGSTTNVTMTLPTATLTVNVKRLGSNVSGATVRVTGGPMAINVTGTTNFSGNATFTNVPVGSGYTVKAWNCTSGSPNRSGQVSPVTKTSGSQTVNLTFDSSNVCPLP